MRTKWTSRFLRVLAILAVLSMFFAALAQSAGATLNESDFPGNAPAFKTVWSELDLPVQEGNANRTWNWGPTINGSVQENYKESPNGQRQVLYFDKTRMEITHPNGDQSSEWYVTNGLLATELTTGQMQVGDNSFVCFQPANVFIAGDNVPQNPTYAMFNRLMSFKAFPNGWKLDQLLQPNGVPIDDTTNLSYGVTAVDVGSPTGHTVASVFWDYMNSSGLVYNYATNTESNGKLFSNPFYATGYPITEAYWANILVGGVEKHVLIQDFQRRVLTYTPSNPDGWKVEAGNVGIQYRNWRYGGGQVPCGGNTTPTPPSCTSNCGGTPPPSNGGSCESCTTGSIPGLTGTSLSHGAWQIHDNAGGDPIVAAWLSRLRNPDPADWKVFPNVANPDVPDFSTSNGMEYGTYSTPFCQQDQRCDFPVGAWEYRYYSGDYDFEGISCNGRGSDTNNCMLVVINVGDHSTTFRDQSFDNGFTLRGRYFNGDQLDWGVWGLVSNGAANMLNMPTYAHPGEVLNSGSPGNSGANCGTPYGCHCVSVTVIVVAGDRFLAVAQTAVVRPN